MDWWSERHKSTVDVEDGNMRILIKEKLTLIRSLSS